VLVKRRHFGSILKRQFTAKNARMCLPKGQT
jgi:hypothetical protein